MRFRTHIGVFALAGVLTTLVFLLTPPVKPVVSDSDSPDAYSYIRVADGDINGVKKPFSGRFLHPFLAGRINDILSIGITKSFLLIAVFSLFFFFTAITLIL